MEGDREREREIRERWRREILKREGSRGKGNDREKGKSEREIWRNRIGKTKEMVRDEQKGV